MVGRDAVEGRNVKVKMDGMVDLELVFKFGKVGEEVDRW